MRHGEAPGEWKEAEREVVREQTRFGECLHSRSADYTKGIFQSIGFKEFHAYLVLPEDEKQEKKVSRSGELQRRHVFFVVAARRCYTNQTFYIF